MSKNGPPPQHNLVKTTIVKTQPTVAQNPQPQHNLVKTIIVKTQPTVVHNPQPQPPTIGFVQPISSAVIKNMSPQSTKILTSGGSSATSVTTPFATPPLIFSAFHKPHKSHKNPNSGPNVQLKSTTVIKNPIAVVTHILQTHPEIHNEVSDIKVKKIISKK